MQGLIRGDPAEIAISRFGPFWPWQFGANFRNRHKSACGGRNRDLRRFFAFSPQNGPGSRFWAEKILKNFSKIFAKNQKRVIFFIERDFGLDRAAQPRGSVEIARGLHHFVRQRKWNKMAQKQVWVDSRQPARNRLFRDFGLPKNRPKIGPKSRFSEENFFFETGKMRISARKKCYGPHFWPILVVSPRRTRQNSTRKSPTPGWRWAENGPFGPGLAFGPKKQGGPLAKIAENFRNFSKIFENFFGAKLAILAEKSQKRE